MICLQTDKHLRFSILSETTCPVLSIFVPCIRLWKEMIPHPGESFAIFINIQFQKWLGFLLCFSKLLTSRQSVVPKVWRNLAVVSLKTGTTNFNSN